MATPRKTAAPRQLKSDEGTESTEPTTQETPKSRDDLLRQSYTEAMAQLREENITRFNELRVKAAKALGVEWKPKPTKEEQAKADLERLIAEHPHLENALREKYAPEQPALPEDPDQEG
jgi:hypothetical protein